jgi:dTDP-4-dehydrorhamnose 3,5-epimerase-like enzyme
MDKFKVIEIPVIRDSRGNLSFVESEKHVPFSISRVYYLYDVPGGSERGGHAHKKLKQLIIALAGSFDVVLDDGFNKTVINLNRAHQGLHLESMVWREILNFSSGSICMVLASDFYNESDYIRDHDKFLEMIYENSKK